MIYLATFYSHFGAMRYKKYCESRGLVVKLMPVPRDLSSSCGTCVSYEAASPCLAEANAEILEMEQLVQVETQGYKLIYQASNS